MKRLFFIDESGYNGDYVFAAVCFDDQNIPKKIIHKWRQWMKNRLGKGLKVNEYHHKDVKNNERRKILTEIVKYDGHVQIWAILCKRYNGNHKEYYVSTIVELLKHCGVTECDTIIAVDKVENKNAHMERYIRRIKNELKMPGLMINYYNSEQIKGLQVADAVAGTISMEMCPRGEASYFDIIKKLMPYEVKIIEIK